MDGEDPEKGRVRRSSDVERPVSHHTDETDLHEEEDEVEVSKEEKGHQRTSKRKGSTESSTHENVVVSAATFGEPSGEGIYACDPACSPCRTRSRASSVRSRPLTIVPRTKRRGLLGKIAIIPEVERPYDYKNSTKWTITAAISLATAAAPMGSSIFYRMLNSWLFFIPLSLYIALKKKNCEAP